MILLGKSSLIFLMVCMFRFVFFALLLPLSGFADFYNAEGERCNKEQFYRAGLRHIEGGGIGYNEGYTTLEMFLSRDPSQWEITPFLDVRGHVFNNGKWAANAGVGLRALWGDQVLGINTYYDYRKASRLNSNQVGVGFEALGNLFDFRINGYLPVGKSISTPFDTTFGGFFENYMLLSQKYQYAMRGVNAEVGCHFRKTALFDLYAAAGPYCFKGEMGSSTWGGKARVAATFRDILTLEISDSYDRAFHNKFQGQISLNYFFGPKSKVQREARTCRAVNTLNERMLQPVNRQEIIVIDTTKQKNVAIDPVTKQPYFFVFVDNTSSSNGTYESPYHTFTQAQDRSSSNDIIYVFPGDGTTTGMDSGILLKANQKFWGSGTSHLIQTSQGAVTIPLQSASSPIITNTNIDTEGNAITLATNNAISGFTIASASNDAIHGTDPQSLEVSSCTFESTVTYAINAAFPAAAVVSVTDNQFLSNVNGINLVFNGTSTLTCSNNTFKDQTSVSSTPLEISANSNVLTANIENNVFDSNTAGSIRFNIDTVAQADINVLNNTITNNGTGSQSSLGSSFVVISSGTNDACTISLKGNTFSGNTSNSLYLHTSGAFVNLDVTASTNTMSGNGGSALVLATPVDNLTLVATDNIITACNDNGIAVISSSPSLTGTITISNNTITDIGNASNGIAINQDFSTLALTVSNNVINSCEGTGILSYAPTGISSLTLNISKNTVNNCQNLSSNAASGIDIEEYTNLEASITDNTLTGNTGLAVIVGSTLPTPTACLTLTGNDSSTDYLLSNPIDGLFELSPCNVDALNVGTINESGVITPVQSCPGGAPCP